MWTSSSRTALPATCCSRASRAASSTLTRQLKGIFMKNFKTKMAALAIKNEFHALKASLDPNEVGGTAMLGISKPVIKAHGSSDARAIYNAIRQAIAFVDSGIIDDITANIAYMRVDRHAAKESN
ncbi:MAG: hypothetical protein ACLSHG_01950 [Oscillospiraceae bacterium]